MGRCAPKIGAVFPSISISLLGIDPCWSFHFSFTDESGHVLCPVSALRSHRSNRILVRSGLIDSDIITQPWSPTGTPPSSTDGPSSSQGGQAPAVHGLFAYLECHSRVIDRMHRLSHELCLEMNATEVEAEKEPLKLRIDEARGIIEKVGGSARQRPTASRLDAH